MSGKTPLISVIIPAFNCARFLPEAVASVRSQSYEPMEIIIIDDGSTDDTAAVIDAFGPSVRSSRQSNQGPAAARNRGLDLAAGELVAFIDADDLWADGRLKTQLNRLLKETGTDVLVGATQRVRAGGEDPDGAVSAFLEPFGPVWMLFHLGASLIRREVFHTVGQFDESLRQGEDVDWFMRAREAGTVIGVSNDLAQYYRIHARNMTRNLAEKERFFLAAMKKSLDRRRAEKTSAEELPEVEGLSEFRAKTRDGE